jgi:hypothetical protein
MSTAESRASNQRSSTCSRRGFSQRAGSITRSRRGFSRRAKTHTQTRPGFSRRAKTRTRNRRVLLSPPSTALRISVQNDGVSCTISLSCKLPYVRALI